MYLSRKILTEWRQAQVVRSGRYESDNRNDEQISSWHAPKKWLWKCNINSVAWPVYAVVGFGAVLRNCNGYLLTAFSRQYTGCHMPFKAALLGCRQTLRNLSSFCSKG